MKNKNIQPTKNSKQIEELYLSLIKEKNLKNLPYSYDFLTNTAYQTPNKAVVLAAGTGGGKTIISILWSMIYYQNPFNRGNITLILPASKTILRENYSTELAKLNPSFSWREVKDKKELIDAINDGIEVIIGLPQTIMKNYTLLPKVDRFILDEAHEWYFAKGKNGNDGSIQKLIKHITPTEQLLLTGSPSKFVARGNDFIFKFVPVLELYELGQAGNVKLEVVSSSYDFKNDDWKGTYGNLKGNKTNSKKEAEHSLKLVCNEMLNKLKNKYKNLHSLNNITGNKIGWLFNYLEKTTIYTHSKKQANAFYTILNEIPELSGKIRKSHSENDPTSKEFKEFKDGVDGFGNPVDIKILIAVDRGRIGFNMPELFHIIDFTMTQNLDMLLQMYGRLLRVSDLNPNKQKIYFKVATKNTADYFVDLMTAMLCLTNMEWYSKYNGKNMGGIRIPKVLTKKRAKTSAGGGGNPSKTTKPYVSIEELGIPLDLNLFKNSILHSSNGLFSTIAWTTLDDVRREFFNIEKYSIANKDEFIELSSKYDLVSTFATENPKEYEIINEKAWNDGMFSHMKDYINHNSKSVDELLQYVKINNITKSHPEYKSIHSKIMSYAN
jgi:superfamily II DNA or RNA helicase